MKKINNLSIIGIDHGYGNMKTANCCFSTGVTVSDNEPTFASDLLIWNDRYYSIGEGHKEFTADKFRDEDYYVLTLAAIAKELRRERITEASVFIAAGLPLTWVSSQKSEFKEYLLQNEEVYFTFRGTEYHIRIVGAEIYPQGFAAVAERLGDFRGVNLLCDIGNGTMNLLKIVNKKPDAQQMFTEKYGTHQCALLIREQMMEQRVNLRFNLNRQDDRRAWEYLKQQTVLRESSLNRTLVEILLEHFAAQEKIDSEDALIDRIVAAVRKELRQSPAFSLSQLFQPPAAESPSTDKESEENEAIVEEFLENF